MPHIKQPLQQVSLSIKVNKYKKLVFSFVCKVMEYPQTHTQKLNMSKEKKTFLYHPIPLNSGTTPLDENIYHSFVALTLIGG